MALLGLCGLQGVPAHSQVALLLAWGGVTGAPHVVTMATMRSALEPTPTPSAAAGTSVPPEASPRELRSWPTPLLIDTLQGLAAVYERLPRPEQWWVYSRLRSDAALHMAGPRGVELSRLLLRPHTGSPALFYDPASFIALRKRCVDAISCELASRLENAEVELRRGFMERRSPHPQSPVDGPFATPSEAARTALAQFGGFGGLISVCESAVSLQAAGMPRLFASLASLMTMRAVCRSLMQSMVVGGRVEVLGTVPGGTRHAQFSCATGKPLRAPLCPLPAAGAAADESGGGGAGQTPFNEPPLPVACAPGDLARLMRVLVASSLGGPAAAFACGVMRFMRSDRPSDAASVRAYLDAASATDVARFVQAVARLHFLHLKNSRDNSSNGGVRGAGRASPDGPVADVPVATPSVSDAAGGELDDLCSDDEALLESSRGGRGHGSSTQRSAAPKSALPSEARGGYSSEIADLIYDGTLRTLPRLADVVSAHLAAASGGALAEGGAPSRLVVPLAQIILPLRIMCEALGLLEVSVSLH